MASGSNAVILYRTTGFNAAAQPIFAPPVSYPVGTDPVSVTIQDINGDGVPDMIVANYGSNNVSILFGSWDASGNWVGTLGPRLKSSGLGPVATTLRDMSGNGIPELVVTNGQSGTLAVLPGVGQGFFNDQNPQILKSPQSRDRAPSIDNQTGEGVVATAGGQLVGFNLNDFPATCGHLIHAGAWSGGRRCPVTGRRRRFCCAQRRDGCRSPAGQCRQVDAGRHIPVPNGNQPILAPSMCFPAVKCS